MMNCLESIKTTINTYRTSKYIIVQKLELITDVFSHSEVISHDTYYKRNKWRDKKYETEFKERKRINGKRLKCSMYSKVYVE